MKIQIFPEELFYKDIYRLVENLLINDVNYSNGHYYKGTVSDMILSNKEKAKYILERMEQEKHLIESDSPPQGDVEILVSFRRVLGLAEGLADDDSWYAERRNAEEIIKQGKDAILALSQSSAKEFDVKDMLNAWDARNEYKLRTGKKDDRTFDEWFDQYRKGK